MVWSTPKQLHRQDCLRTSRTCRFSFYLPCSLWIDPQRPLIRTNTGFALSQFWHFLDFVVLWQSSSLYQRKHASFCSQSYWIRLDQDFTECFCFPFTLFPTKRKIGCHGWARLFNWLPLLEKLVDIVPHPHWSWVLQWISIVHLSQTLAILCQYRHQWKQGPPFPEVFK